MVFGVDLLLPKPAAEPLLSPLSGWSDLNLSRSGECRATGALRRCSSFPGAQGSRREESAHVVR